MLFLNRSSKIRYLPTVWVVLTLLLCVFGSIGVILMRHKITHAAFETKILEAELLKLERKHQYLQSRLAQIEQPSYLVTKISQELKAPQAHLVVRAGSVPKAQLPKAHAIETFNKEPFTLSLDLAFLATTSH